MTSKNQSSEQKPKRIRKVKPENVIESNLQHPLYQFVSDFLTEESIEHGPVNVDEGADGPLSFFIEGNVYLNNGPCKIIVIGNERKRYIRIYAVSRLYIPAPKRLKIAEFLAFANYELIHGCLEMDMGDGEVRFRTDLSCRDGDLSRSTLEVMLYTCLSNMDAFQPGLEAVVTGDKTPEEACAAGLEQEKHN